MCRIVCGDSHISGEPSAQLCVTQPTLENCGTSGKRSEEEGEINIDKELISFMANVG